MTLYANYEALDLDFVGQQAVVMMYGGMKKHERLA